MRRQDAPLREAYISYICAGLLNALDYMHTEVKAIHRDIKAANYDSNPTPPLPLTLTLPLNPSPSPSPTLTPPTHTPNPRRPTCCSLPTRASSSPTSAWRLSSTTPCLSEAR